jgi:hypothetical protein
VKQEMERSGFQAGRSMAGPDEILIALFDHLVGLEPNPVLPHSPKKRDK